MQAVDTVQFLAKGEEHLKTAKHPHEQRLIMESVHETASAIAEDVRLPPRPPWRGAGEMRVLIAMAGMSKGSDAELESVRLVSVLIAVCPMLSGELR